MGLSDIGGHDWDVREKHWWLWSVVSLYGSDITYWTGATEGVGRDVIHTRIEDYTAGDIAKNLWDKPRTNAEKGSFNNLSVVVVFLDDVCILFAIYFRYRLY